MQTQAGQESRDCPQKIWVITDVRNRSILYPHASPTGRGVMLPADWLPRDWRQLQPQRSSRILDYYNLLLPFRDVLGWKVSRSCTCSSWRDLIVRGAGLTRWHSGHNNRVHSTINVYDIMNSHMLQYKNFTLRQMTMRIHWEIHQL